MPFCLKGGVVLLSGFVCLYVAGCGIPNRGIHTIETPLSHIQVEETVIERALENLGLPAGYGMEITCEVEGDDSAGDMLRLIAPEVLHRKNYLVVEKKSSAPVIKLSVDTLYVTLTKERSKQAGKLIKRIAGADIGAVILRPDGTRQVFIGRGTFEDSFDSYMLEFVDSNDPYVNDLVSKDGLISGFKPVFIGFAMTVFAWMLYSYRG